MAYVPMGCKRPAGYCMLHRKTMSVKQIRRKACIQKKCFHLKKVNGHPFWKQREERRKKRKQKKRTPETEMEEKHHG